MASGDDELCYITATEAISAFKSRELSPVELMKAVISRSEGVNPKVNAFAHKFFDRALDQANAAEKKYAKGHDIRPLEGVPIVIKDAAPVAGEITTFGHHYFADNVSETSAPTVARLLDAGAVMHARSTTPSLVWGPMVQSKLWGITRNPWNLDYNPGGSSGGSAVAVATGMTTLSDGVDAGGSIRQPASCSGVFGYYPPFGRNPVNLDWARETMLSFGPLTRSVADAALMQNVMAGAHPEDICSLKPKLEIPDRLEGIKGWKIAFSMNLGYFEVDKEVQANTLEALEAFKSLGCTVEEVDIGWDFSVLDAWTTMWEAAFWAWGRDLYPRLKYDMDSFARILLERGAQHSAERYYKTNQVRARMYQTLAPILETHDILVCPSTAVPSLTVDHDLEDKDFRINDKKLTYANHAGDIYVQWQLCYPFNLVPECPVASVPSGFASSGVPTGIQIVGPSFEDVVVFRAAADYERARPWRQHRPNL